MCDFWLKVVNVDGYKRTCRKGGELRKMFVRGLDLLINVPGVVSFGAAHDVKKTTVWRLS